MSRLGTDSFEEQAPGGNRARPMPDRAGRHETDDRLSAIAAAVKGVDPNMTLQALCDRLEAMRAHPAWTRRLAAVFRQDALGAC